MMREDDSDEFRTRSSSNKKNPLTWTVRSARRVQLAVRTSITSSVSKRALFEDDEHDNGSEVATLSTWDDNANIDQAMMGLYSLPDQHSHNVLFPDRTTTRTARSIYDVSSLLNQSSSYIPQDDCDDIIDGGYRDIGEEERSKTLFDALFNYEASDDWKAALARGNEPLNAESSSSDCDENHDDDDGDEFGDFQSASAAEPTESETHVEAPKAAKVEFVLATPPSNQHRRGNNLNDIEDEPSVGTFATSTTTNTVGLVKRVDDLFSPASSVDENEMFSTLSNDFSTPALLAQAHDLLARVAQESEDEDEQSAMENDHDSDATPRTNIRRRESLSYATPSRQLSKDFAGSTKISMELPVTDLTCIESRWTRRRQRECQAELLHDNKLDEPRLDDLHQIISELPELYQIPIDKINDGPVETNASMIRILNSVPWGCVQLDENDYAGGRNDLSVWDDFITGQLSQLDSALQDVQKIMAASVNPDKLEVANDLVHSCERNLRLAQIYWDRSSQALDAAVALEPDGSYNGTGVLGNAHLLDLWQQKEDVKGLDDLLLRLHDVTQQEKEIIRRIDTFDAKHSRAQDEYSEVVKLCKKLRGTVDGNLGQLKCLSELRDSRLTSILEERFWNRLKYLSRQNVVRVCRQRDFPAFEYTALVKAACGLFDASQSNHGPSSKVLVTESHSQFDNESGWSKNIVNAILYEAERSFASALLEPVDVDDSAFVKDLTSLGQELGKDWGDFAKLKTLTHNLVTIRFDFERSMCYLPRVMVRLCELLLDILRGHVVFHQIHGATLDSTMSDVENNELLAFPDSSTLLLSIAEGLGNARQEVWEKCESIMIHAMNEYKNFASKRVLFENNKEGMDDSLWEKELQGLHMVYCSICCFLKFKPTFLGTVVTSDIAISESQSGLFDTLREIAAEHLRAVHVEAMTSIGRMLSRETWYLVDTEIPDESEKKTDPPSTNVSSRQILSDTVRCFIQKHKVLAKFYSLTPGCPYDHFDVPSTENLQFVHSSATNAFEVAGLHATRVQSDAITSIFDEIDGAVNSASTFRIATLSVKDGLVPWLSRLAMVAVKVPVVCEKVCTCLENIFDLYYTTVFRLCAGSRRNERILLGEDASVASMESLSPFPGARKRASSPLGFGGFGQERRPSGKPPSIPNRTSITISSTLDIEMCAPMTKDAEDVARALSFIDRAQQELHGNVNLNRVDSWIGNPNVQDDPEEYACAVAKSVERREAAAWSCLVVTGLAEVIFSTIASCLNTEEGSSSRTIESLKTYVLSAAAAIPTVSRKASEVSCTRAFSPSGFVQQIVQVGGGWEESKLHEHPNDYVEALCERVCLIWGFIAASGKLPEHLETQIWARLVQTAYLTLIEGFSRVMFCSTEGRALMALDLASVSSNLRRDAVHELLESFDLPFTPPHVSPRYGKQYVDLYVKVYYYPQEDAMNWVSQNYPHYRMNHMLALVSGFDGRREKSSVLIDKVRRLYE